MSPARASSNTAPVQLIDNLIDPIPPISWNERIAPLLAAKLAADQAALEAAQQQAAQEAAEQQRLAAVQLAAVTTREVQGQQALSADNTYDWGNCTWYAKSQRPDIPNTFGNASNWFYAAQTAGMATGWSPQIGAVAWYRYGNHVAIVKQINGDQILLSEMNVLGLNVISQRWVSTADYGYIY